MGRKSREKRLRKLQKKTAHLRTPLGMPLGLQQLNMATGRQPAVSRFLTCRDIFRSWIKKLEGHDHQHDAVRITELLSEARIILLPKEFSETIWVEANQEQAANFDKTYEEVCGEAPPKFPEQVVKDAPLAERMRDGSRIWKLQHDHWTGRPQQVRDHISQKLCGPYLERLPFPVTYLGFETPFLYGETTSVLMNRRSNRVPFNEKQLDPPEEKKLDIVHRLLKEECYSANIVPPCGIFGFVLSDQDCFSIVYGRYAKQPDAGIALPVREYDQTRWKSTRGLERGWWYHPESAFSLFISCVIDWIFDHKTIIDSPYQLPQPKEKSISISIPKKLPEPYYVVYMDDVVKVKSWLDTRSKHPKTGRVHLSPQHRFDVREHDRIRVLRGPLPLDPKIRRQLEAVRPVSGRSYKVYTELQPEGETAELLFKRGIKRKQPDEWMAVLVTPIHHHIKGPTEGPYIPSVRKAKQHATADDNTNVNEGELN